MPRVLVADDDTNFRRLTGTILEEAGHEVGYAVDGKQAVDFFRKGEFDALVIDLALPEKNGVQAIREIIAQEPAAKIIAISGKTPEQLSLAEEAGALRTLAKPFANEDLVTAVASVLRRATGWQGVTD